MKRIIIFAILTLIISQPAFAQEWFEAAESSGLGYEMEMRHPIATDKKEVKLDEETIREIESLSSDSSFKLRNYEAGGSSPAGVLGMEHNGMGSLDDLLDDPNSYTGTD
jgi:hypothetical protein